MASSTFLHIKLSTTKGFFLRPEDDSDLSDDEQQQAKRRRLDAGDRSTSGNIPAVFYVLTLEPGEQAQAADHVRQYVRADLALHEVCHDAAVEKEGKRLGWKMQPSVIIHNASAQPDDQDGSQGDTYLERCLVCVFSSNVAEQEVPEQWGAAVKKHMKDFRPKIRVFKMLQEEGAASDVKRVYSSTEIELDAAEGVEPKQSLRYIQCDGPSASPGPAPVFDYPSYSPIFKTLDRVLQILEMCNDLEPVKELFGLEPVRELLSIAEKKLQPLKNEELPFKFVVIEGLDGAGKSTLNKKLKERCPNAGFCYGMPEYLRDLRKGFDELPEIVRRAFYCLGNYIRARELQDMCQTQHVFVDRFWHSSTAYPIAHECSHQDIPPAGHPVYCWPDDLLQPSIIFFLTVSEEVRNQRLGNRPDQTKEEQTLGSDEDFRWRLGEAYRRIIPACTEIDANGSEDSVLEKVWNIWENLASKCKFQHLCKL